MISIERMEINQIRWEELDKFEDRVLFQTSPWINFLVETQLAEPVVAAVKINGNILGYFTGLTFNKFGIKILGSPFKGWTTDYMGLNLPNGFPRKDILETLSSFAFNSLKCHYLEIVDQHICNDDLSDLSYTIKYFQNLEIDLTKDESELFANMDNKSCRWCIRKAEKSGVIIEKANDDVFAEEYFNQLKDVFAKQSLVPTYTIERVRNLIKHLLPTGNLLLLRARNPEGLCIATGIFPAFNKTMYFWGATSWRKYQSFRPNELLIWNAMKYWKSRGMSKFDMGGLRDYKRKFGSKEISVPRIMKAKYNSLILLRDFSQRIWKIQQKTKGLFK